MKLSVFAYKCRYPFLRVIQRGLQPSWSQARGFSPSQASHLRELAHCLLCLVSCIACPLVWFLISDFWFLAISGIFRNEFLNSCPLRQPASKRASRCKATRRASKWLSTARRRDWEHEREHKQKNPKMSEAVTRLYSPMCSKLWA